MKSVSRWFIARPHRATIVNIVMLTILLLMIGSGGLFLMVGGAALALAAISFGAEAVAATARSWRSTTLYGFLLAWVPGILAVGLAAVGMILIAGSDSTSLRFNLGAVLLGVQLVLIVVATADLSGAQPPSDTVAGRA